MSDDPVRCPLCLREEARATPNALPDRDIVRIRCPRCGTFLIDPLVATGIQARLGNRVCLVSWATRTATESRSEVVIESLETAEALASSAPMWHTADEGVGRLLLSLATKTRRFTGQFDVKPQIDYPLVPAEDDSQYTDLWQLAIQMGYVDGQYRRITPEGWRRIEALRIATSVSRQAFVAMWFNNSTNDAWEKGLKPGIEASKYYTALRIDKKEFNNKIDDEIIAEIRRSGLLVADFTGHRGGAYFEAGFAMGLGIPVIWTCAEADIGGAHFDTRQYNHIVWKTPQDLADQLDKRIRATVLPLVGRAITGAT